MSTQKPAISGSRRVLDKVDRVFLEKFRVDAKLLVSIYTKKRIQKTMSILSILSTLATPPQMGPTRRYCPAIAITTFTRL
jgi:hypothetical protein